MKVKNIKEFIKDKRNRAIVILILYFVFFIFVATFFRNYSSDVPLIEEKPKTSIEKYCSVGNYAYSYQYQLNGIYFNINGQVFRNENYFIYDDNYYYLKDGITYQMIDNSFIEITLDNYNFYKITDICNMLDNATLIGKNEDYQTNTLSSKYSVPINVINSEYEGEMYLTIYEENDLVNKVELDITNYQNLLDPNINNAVIYISYHDMGEVKNFTTMFDESRVIRGVEE